MIALVGSFAGYRILLVLSERLLQAKSGVAEPIRGLYEVTRSSHVDPVPMFALIVVVLFGIPTLLGLVLRNLECNEKSLQHKWTYD